MKKCVEEILQIIAIATIVPFVWQILEEVMLGEINPNRVDSIIALILIFSLNQNLESWKRKG